MKQLFQIEETIKKRRSIRNYDNRGLSEQQKSEIVNYMNQIENPFQVKVKFHFLETEQLEKGLKLGTYGVIQGAKHYLGITVKNTDFAMEAVGYAFEMLILYATSLGLGTCWLGGTFNRNQFKTAMEISEDEVFPIISPIGSPLEKRTLTDTLVRKIAKSDQRKEWKELFFSSSFENSLLVEEAADYTIALELVRIAPSASNKQPWRIIKDGELFHFFKVQGYGDVFGYDIQSVDMGIAACHFELALEEKQMVGEFYKEQDIKIELPEKTTYSFSWKKCE
jgi:nitroreductase